MANGQLHIVANEDARATLAELCASSAEVEVHGTIVRDGNDSVLVVNEISIQPNTELPIAAESGVAEKLVKVAGTKGPLDVVLSGRIGTGAGGKVLILDDVSEVTSLPVIAAESTRSQLARLAANGDGEVNITAKVAGKGAGRHLILIS